MERRALVRALLGLGVTACLAVPAAADERAVPDLDARVDAHQQQRASQGGGPSAEDRRIMERSTEEVRQQLPDPGLAEGTRAPDFTLPNAFGEPVRLADYLAQGPVILTFYRGAWCPYCNLELRVLKESVPAFREHDARILAVSPQQPDRSLEQVREDGFPFEILSNLDNSVMQDYDLFFQVPEDLVAVYRRMGLDLADYNGDGRYVLPVPGTFIIDRDGMIRAAFADVDYTKRMEPAAILEALEAL